MLVTDQEEAKLKGERYKDLNERRGTPNKDVSINRLCEVGEDLFRLDSDSQ